MGGAGTHVTTGDTPRQRLKGGWLVCLEAAVFQEEHARVSHDRVVGEVGHGGRVQSQRRRKRAADALLRRRPTRYVTRRLPRLLSKFQLDQTGRYATDRHAGEGMDATAVELYEDGVRLVDEPLILHVVRLERIQDQNHTGVECLLPKSPADQDRWFAMVEEEKSLQKVNR